MDRAVAGSPPASRWPERGLDALFVWAGIAVLLETPALGTSTTLAFDPMAALGAIAGELPITAPASVAVLGATALNILAGAMVLRLLVGRPFATLADALLGGLATAVVGDAALVFGLGGAGFFGLPEVVAVHLLAILVGRRWGRPVFTARTSDRRWLLRPSSVWLPVAAVWAAPILLALASPVVPFMDVLPNHVAPVEHLRAFGSQATLTTMPSPIYGPSRLFLGYVGLLGVVSVLTGLHAALAVSAFVLPLAVLCAFAVADVARRLFGRDAARWALLTFPLTFAFVRISDARATVVVVPLICWAVGRLVLPLDSVRWNLRGLGGRRLGRVSTLPDVDVGLCLALGAAVLVHPALGACTILTAALTACAAPRRLARRVGPAVAGAGALALPQLATFLGLGLPAAVGLASLPLAAALALGTVAVLDRAGGPVALIFARMPHVDRRLGRLLGALVAGALAVAAAATLPIQSFATDIHDHFPVLTLLAAVALVLTVRRRPRAWPPIFIGVVLFLGGVAGADLVPGDSLTAQSLRYELPKALDYWGPLILAIAAAGALAAVWRLRRAGWLRHVAIGAFLLAAAVPLSGPLAPAIDIREHRFAETLAADLQAAEQGAWAGYRDPRLVVDTPGEQLVDYLRGEVAAGRLRADDTVLHVASSFQQWSAVPIGVFTGALETDVTLDPEQSIHTQGGRLLGLDTLAAQLALRPAYVVLEPSGLPGDLMKRIETAGYRPSFENGPVRVFVSVGVAGTS